MLLAVYGLLENGLFAVVLSVVQDVAGFEFSF